MVLVLTASLALAAPHADIVEGVEPPPRMVTTGSINSELYGRTTLKGWVFILNQWTFLPLYAKLSIIDDLLEAIEHPKSCEVPNYAWTPGSHDLSNSAGRAAVLVEHLFHIKLMPVTPRSTGEELQATFRQAFVSLRTHKWLVTLVKSGKPLSEAETQILSEKHQQRMTLAAARGGLFLDAVAFNETLIEVFPIGKRFSDLEEITKIRAAKRNGNIRIVCFGAGQLQMYTSRG